MENTLELERLLVRLTGDGSEYQKMIQTATQSTQQAAKVVEAAATRIEKFGDRVKGVGSAVMGALGVLGITGTLKQAFGAFAEAETIGVQLGVILESNKRNVDEVRKSYEEWAVQLEKVTVYEDDAILKMAKTAESYGLTGDQAKYAVESAIGLATITEGNAESMMRLTQALAQGDIKGAQRFARMIPQLKNVKNESEFVAKAQHLIETGMKAAAAEMETSAGVLKVLHRDWGNLLEDYGKVVSEGLKPIVQWTTKAVAALRALSDETKKVITIVALVGAAVLALGPIMAILGPLTAPLFRLGGLFLSLLNPIKLVGSVVAGLSSVFGLISGAASILMTVISGIAGGVALVATPLGAIAVIAAAVGTTFLILKARTVDWASTGVSVLSWFGKQWETLVADVKSAMVGIGDAVKAGDLSLAFEIMWTQVKLSFMILVEDMYIKWIEFSSNVKAVWYQMGGDLVSYWQKTVHSIADLLVTAGQAVGMWNKEEAQQIKDIMNADAEWQKKENDRKTKADVDKSLQAGFDARKNVVMQINDLKAKRDELLKKAAEAAAAVPPPKPMVLPQPIVPKIPSQNVKVNVRFDAAEAGSSEALSRIAEFRDALREGGAIKPKKTPKPSTPLDFFYPNLPDSRNKERLRNEVLPPEIDLRKPIQKLPFNRPLFIPDTPEDKRRAADKQEMQLQKIAEILERMEKQGDRDNPKLVLEGIGLVPANF